MTIRTALAISLDNSISNDQKRHELRLILNEAGKLADSTESPEIRLLAEAIHALISLLALEQKDGLRSAAEDFRVGAKQAIYLVAGVCAFFAAVALGIYAWNFYGRWPPSDDPQHWGVFGDYVGGVLNPLFAVVNVSVIIYIAYRIRQLEEKHDLDARKAQEAADRARRESEQRLNAVRLLDTVYSLQFYKEVAAPVWEVFVKWRHWKGEQGNQYRMSVVTGFVSFSDHYRDFEKPEELPMPGHNIIRFGDHYHPSDYSPGQARSGYVQTVLSEHQALTCWLEFWGNVNTMISKELADADTVSDLLADWYQYWIDFMVELRWIVRTLHARKQTTPDGPATVFPEPEPRWAREIESLERVFYCRSKDGGAAHYAVQKHKCEERASAILNELLPLLPKKVATPVPKPAEPIAAPDPARM